MSSSAESQVKSERPWDKSYPAGIRWDAEVPATTMIQMFDEAVKKNGNKTALNFMGKKMTYRELGEAVGRFSKGLQDQGIGKDSHVGLCLPDSPFHVIALYGALKAGATAVNFNPLYAEQEMQHLIDDSKCDIMVSFNSKPLQKKLDKLLETSHLKKNVVADIAEALPLLKRIGFRIQNMLKERKGKGDTVPVVNDSKHIAFSTLLKSKGSPAPVSIDVDDVALLQYTGGTTGVPKACMLTHRNLTSNITQSEMWFGATGDKKAGTKQGKMLAVLPFFHVFAMTVQENLSLKLGAELVMLPKPDIEETLKVIEKERPTMFAGVPTLYQGMADFKRKPPGKLASIFNKLAFRKPKTSFDLSSVDLWLTGGAATPETLEQEWEKFTSKPFVKGYGLSETSPLVIAMPLGGAQVQGSIGLPIPQTEVRIVNIEDASKECGLGEDGEICVRGPQVMKGYWNRPDETEKVIDKDGFFHTGDTGYVDANGYVFVTGRLKDMINRAGLKVFPLKVEGAILQHPDVHEVCVIGVPDPKLGEEVKAHIVFKEGKEVSNADMKSFLKDKLAPYEIPHLWQYRDSLPKTAIGKPDKKVLKAEEQAKAAANNNEPAKPAATAQANRP